MTPRKPGFSKGFARASKLLSGQIRKAGESRGFAVTRLLTHWPEIAGPDIADIARPVEISYGRGGFGATLSLLTTGANAPMLEMQKEKLRERVNATYGYNAISRIRITQTHATGFAEGQVSFEHRAAKPAPKTPDPAVKQAAHDAVKPVADSDLRAALETLGENVLSKSKHQKGHRQ
ncbi:DciA family protein [Alisedimentitalea sp. MJ-SS2]|uniref:DUF721 domain-containing protein n=1 Tax=Aliisedimentitalea sp. MJ-SS2 TaxID=3049795 RepID=UPI002909477F|nr:DciA family protein [Alisedimentitalea sp. MJ-SS2]MDU8928064.1 DciA family protein [Alisedimentitalea sp. MJ-SS2]